jgi:hypothetical protein
MNWTAIGIAVTALAAFVGWGWTLYKNAVERTHRPRLKFRVSGERIIRDEHEYLLIKAELENVGLSKVELEAGCTVTLYALRLPKKVRIVMDPKRDELGTFGLFDDDHWVEPSGLLIDQRLVVLPGLASSFVYLKAHFASTKVDLNANAVVAPFRPMGTLPQ